MTHSQIIASRALSELGAYLHRVCMEPPCYVVGDMLYGQIRSEMYPYRTGWPRAYAAAAVALYRAHGYFITDRLKAAADGLRRAA